MPFDILKRSQTDKNAFTDNLGPEVIFCNNASACIRKMRNLSPLTSKFSVAVKLEIKQIIVHTPNLREYFTFSHHSHSNITFYLLGMLPSDQNENEGARFNFKNVQIRANFFEELM